MNPLAIIPVEYRFTAQIIGIVALGLALMLGYYRLTAYHEAIGYQHAVDVFAAQSHRAEVAARAQEKTMNDQIRKAEDDAAEREKRHKVELAVAQSRYVRMRDDYAALRANLSGLSAAACAATADAALDVFEQCSAELGALAQAADGHASDAQTLTDAWPK